LTSYKREGNFSVGCHKYQQIKRKSGQRGGKCIALKGGCCKVKGSLRGAAGNKASYAPAERDRPHRGGDKGESDLRKEITNKRRGGGNRDAGKGFNCGEGAAGEFGSYRSTYLWSKTTPSAAGLPEGQPGKKWKWPNDGVECVFFGRKKVAKGSWLVRDSIIMTREGKGGVYVMGSAIQKKGTTNLIKKINSQSRGGIGKTLIARVPVYNARRKLAEVKGGRIGYTSEREHAVNS